MKDDADYTFEGNAVIAYLCMNALSLEWEQCEVFTTTVYAYACEARHNAAQGASYRRLQASPKVTKVSPSAGGPGAVLTVSGQHLDAGFSGSGDDGNAASLAAALEVTLGGAPCVVTAANATQLTCNLTAAGSSSSSSGAGVVPVRVAASGYGWAGPGLLPLFTVQHQLFNVTPAAGSLGGGQNVTLIGANLPTDLARFQVTLTVAANNTNGTQVRVSSACAALVAAADGSAVVCTTGALSSDVLASSADGSPELTRYAAGQGRSASFRDGRTYAASLDVEVLLSMDGDFLRYTRTVDGCDVVFVFCFGNSNRRGILRF